jgi:hypothetical protein
MKKIILAILFSINLLPFMESGNFSIHPAQQALAQHEGCGGNTHSGGGEIFGGTSFWDWLGNAFGNIGDAIAGLFSNNDENNDGEGFGDEEEDSGEGGDDDAESHMTDEGNSLSDNYYEEFSNTYNFTPNDWYVIHNLGYYYDYFINNPGQLPPAPPDKFYISVDNFNGITDPTKYYDGDTIFIQRRENPVGLSVHNQTGSISPVDMGWKKNDTLTSVYSTSWVFSPRNEETFINKVDSMAVRIYLKNKVNVYQPPTIIFERGNNYDGEYGFDDSSHQHSNIDDTLRWAPGTETRTINGASYVVPWMSLLDSQSATIKIKKLNMTRAAKKDPAFGVNLVPSDPAIRLNGAASLSLNYTQLDALRTLNVSATQWKDKADSLKTIGTVYAITFAGDTIGKLNLSCSKPIIRNIVIVYVSIGTGYLNTGSHSKASILDYLNKHSHNQLMRRWVLDSSFNYLDTLDLTHEYATQPNAFADPDTLHRKMRPFFLAHKGVGFSIFNSPTGPRSPNRRHVIFVVNMPMGTTAGNAELGGVQGEVYSTSTKKTFTHELAHMLRLPHTFSDSPSEPNLRIPIHTTQNFMDYSVNENMFYFCQWVDVF